MLRGTVILCTMAQALLGAAAAMRRPMLIGKQRSRPGLNGGPPRNSWSRAAAMAPRKPFGISQATSQALSRRVPRRRGDAVREGRTGLL